MTPPSIALTIAGSDPSGGAGIQADLKTFHQFGVYGEAVITLLTVQNTQVLSRVECLPVDLVLQQIVTLLDDLPPAAAKTGALGSIELIEALGTAAANWKFPLLVDPIMLSKHGARLSPADAAAAFRTHLIPRAALVMPNIPEATALCGFPIESLNDVNRAGKVCSTSAQLPYSSKAATSQATPSTCFSTRASATNIRHSGSPPVIRMAQGVPFRRQSQPSSPKG